MAWGAEDILALAEGVLALPEGIEKWFFPTAIVFTVVANASSPLTIASLTIVSFMAIAMTISITIETIFSLGLTSLRSDFRIGGTRTMDMLTTTTIPIIRYWSGLATAVQTQLASRGYYHGPIDGVIGPESREAIQAFQKSRGLAASGLIDPSLLKALNLPAVPRTA